MLNIVTLDGNVKPLSVFTDHTKPWAHAWHPMKDQIAFFLYLMVPGPETGRINALSIGVIDVDTGHKRVIYTCSEAEKEYLLFGPAMWSPDGKVIAAVTVRREKAERKPDDEAMPITLWHLEGGHMERLIFDDDSAFLCAKIDMLHILVETGANHPARAREAAQRQLKTLKRWRERKHSNFEDMDQMDVQLLSALALTVLGDYAQAAAAIDSRMCLEIRNPMSVPLAREHFDKILSIVVRALSASGKSDLAERIEWARHNLIY